MTVTQQATRTNLTINNGKITILQRGKNSTSLGLTIHNPQRIENLNAPGASKGLIYDNPKEEAAVHFFVIPEGSTIKITLLNSGHSQVLCYQGRNLVKLTRYTTWTRNKYRRR